MNTRSFATVLVCVGTLSSYVTKADAGFKADDSDKIVKIQTGSNPQGFGALGPVRSSGDSNQYIGCDLYGDTATATTFCYANTSSNQQVACYGTDTASILAVKALSYGSFVAFTTDSSGVTCVSINVDNDSSLTPKH